MHGIKFFKKFLMPCGLCAAAPIVKPAPPPNCPTPCDFDEKKQLIRPSELPIYTLSSTAKEEPCPQPANLEPSYLENSFGTVRKSLDGLFTQYRGVADKVTDTIDTGIAHSESLYEYLKEESNSAPRIGAIGIGALTGLVLSLRGGKFKKTLYTTTGGLLIASLCYPKQAKEGVEIAKHYANIGYNFAYGVKPGDANQLEISFPEFPKISMPDSIDGVIDQVIETGSALASKASEFIFEAKEETEKTKSSSSSDLEKPKQS